MAFDDPFPFSTLGQVTHPLVKAPFSMISHVDCRASASMISPAFFHSPLSATGYRLQATGYTYRVFLVIGMH